MEKYDEIIMMVKALLDSTMPTIMSHTTTTLRLRESFSNIITIMDDVDRRPSANTVAVKFKIGGGGYEHIYYLMMLG